MTREELIAELRKDDPKLTEKGATLQADLMDAVSGLVEEMGPSETLSRLRIAALSVLVTQKAFNLPNEGKTN